NEPPTSAATRSRSRPRLAAVRLSRMIRSTATPEPASAAALRASSSVRPEPAVPRTSAEPESIASARAKPSSVCDPSIGRNGSDGRVGRQAAPNTIARVEREIDWLDACRRMAARQADLFERTRSIAERTEYEGRGEGGDMTLKLDRQCEDIVFEELERIAADGIAMSAVSEERGEVLLGSGDPV